MAAFFLAFPTPSARPLIRWRRYHRFLALALLAFQPILAAAYGQEQAERLDRDQLLQYRDEEGQRQTARTPAEWQLRRKEIVRAMQQVMGPLPPATRRVPLDVEQQEEVDCGRYVRRLISYQSEPGSRVPAYLLIPKEALQDDVRCPAVLCLHPTDDQIGHGVVVGLGGRPGRQYAHELAERGFITLAPAYPLLANYQPDLETLGYVSGTMKAIWDNIRALDLLESLAEVDPRPGFGVIGHSLGGHNAIYTAVFDDRLRVIISSCGFDSYLDYKDGDIRGWTSQRYMPRLLAYRDRLEAIPFDFHEMVAALAPRPFLVSAPLGDDNFQWKSVAGILRAARPVYTLHGAEDQLVVHHPDCGHDFPEAMRQQAYALLERELRTSKTPQAD